MLSCYLFTLLKLGSVKKNAKILLKEDNMDIHISNSISQLHFFSNSMAQDKIKKGWGVKKKKKKASKPTPKLLNSLCVHLPRETAKYQCSFLAL